MRFIIITFLLFIASGSLAQNSIPVIKASSKIVDIRDGLHFKKGYWYIMPEKRPDSYFVELPYKEHRVAFITDSDSISFDVKYGEVYDFIILLNNKDSCYTRIVTAYKKVISVTGDHLPPDTIPFTIGNNSKIYFKAKINDSEPLNVQFDLGAGGCVIKKSSIDKVKMNFDGSITLRNSDGINVVPYSSSNRLKIGSLEWDSIDFAVADNMTWREDIIVGNSLFQAKVFEINYDKKVILIYDTLPHLDPGYSKYDIILDGGTVPFLQGSLTINGEKTEGWFMFDTGAYTTILLTSSIPMTHKMYVEARKMLGLNRKKIVLLSPQLTVGTHSFSDFNYTVEKPGGDSALLGLLGNDLLKRFNVLIDNRNGHLYLKPNSLVNEPYANPEYYAVRVGSVILVLLIALILFIFYRRKRKKRQRRTGAIPDKI
jgi:hypothetical protein